MEEITSQARNPLLIEQLVNVWEASVKATHLFLSPAEIAAIKKFVPEALMGVPRLVIERDEVGMPVAFMGFDGTKLEMLFVTPQKRGQGLGKNLLEYGLKQGVNELCVNEQNPQAQGFYEHLGFRVYKRSERDEQGNPYPILYMQLQK
ncbi:GNAT family N-acetyltransferase [Ligilactobacillus agilis]|uniref:GNAT family N-acetyltransferase n=1 Tax=Ligilactobacillus agilis TaxID=1601 RepID=UPI00255CE238|nr:GNAT family N-acetyltransferase [Ligilactobacillus agilis]